MVRILVLYVLWVVWQFLWGLVGLVLAILSGIVVAEAVRKATPEAYLFFFWVAFGGICISLLFAWAAQSRFHVAFHRHPEPCIGKFWRIWFFAVFGFWPKKGETGRVKSFGQNLVDQILKELALIYDDACKEQAQFDGGKTQIATIEEARYEKQQIDRAVAFTKKIFWQAHGLADRAGFKILPKYEDYMR